MRASIDVGRRSRRTSLAPWALNHSYEIVSDEMFSWPLFVIDTSLAGTGKNEWQNDKITLPARAISIGSMA